jgi:hypothetical protein
MGRNEDSLLRAAGAHSLASATRGGSCTHPDQSRGLVHRHNMRAISGVGASSPILLFFIGGGVALHERLVGIEDRSDLPPRKMPSIVLPSRLRAGDAPDVFNSWGKGHCWLSWISCPSYIVEQKGKKERATLRAAHTFVSMLRTLWFRVFFCVYVESDARRSAGRQSGYRHR